MADFKTDLDKKFEAKQKAKTEWDTEKTNWEYVSVPEENALGERHDTISINGRWFWAPGTTTLTPPMTAKTVKERLRAYARGCVRILQPKRDTEAERLVAVGTASPAKFTPVDASTVTTD